MILVSSQVYRRQVLFLKTHVSQIFIYLKEIMLIQNSVMKLDIIIL